MNNHKRQTPKQITKNINNKQNKWPYKIPIKQIKKHKQNTEQRINTNRQINARNIKTTEQINNKSVNKQRKQFIDRTTRKINK